MTIQDKTYAATRALRGASAALAELADALEAGHQPGAPPQRHPAPAPQPARAAPRASGGACAPNFGRCAGQPLDSISDEDLRWYEGALERSVSDPDKAKFRAKNEAQLREIRAELDARFVR